MKYFYFTCLFAFVLSSCLSSSDSSSNVSEKEDELNEEELVEIKQFKESILSSHWEDCTHKNGFKQNCKKCSDLFVNVQLQIGSTGLVQRVGWGEIEFDCTKIKEKKQAKCLDCLEAAISEYEFGEPMFGKKISLRIGKPTKC